jgi:hypothetical protein
MKGVFHSSACWRRNTRIGIKRSRCSGKALKCESKGRVRATSSEHSRKGARPASKPTARISFRCGCSSLPPPPLPTRRKSTDHDSRSPPYRQRLFRLNLGDCDWFGNAYARWPVNSGCPAETGILGSHRKVRASAIRSAFRVYEGARAVPSWTSAGIRVRPSGDLLVLAGSFFWTLDARMVEQESFEHGGSM